MAIGPIVPFEPFFLDGRAGRLFSVYYRPEPARSECTGLVFVPPFAEEMNRTRRMVSLQARELASLGVAVLVVDLYGCGDSAGDFRDARWDVWREDVAVASSWLRAQGIHRIGLWGLRLGGLLAAEVIAASRTPFEQLILWQPTINGSTLLTQFLRARIAAGMSEPGRGESTEGLRAALANGRSVEVAGYDLSPELAAAIDATSLDDLTLPRGLTVDWMEIVPEAGRSISAASQRLIALWGAAGTRVTTAGVVGPPIWSLLETTLAPELLSATRGLFSERAA